MSIDISNAIRKYLTDLPIKHYRQITLKLLDLANTPFPHDSLKMKGYESRYRIDSGEYRVVYEVEGKLVRVVIVGKRNDSDVYKKADRL
jgi:mRNA interferase RelE/StbE